MTDLVEKVTDMLDGFRFSSEPPFNNAKDIIKEVLEHYSEPGNVSVKMRCALNEVASESEDWQSHKAIAAPDAPVVCEWKREFDAHENRKWLRGACGLSYYEHSGTPPFVKCGCGLPISFKTEAQR